MRSICKDLYLCFLPEALSKNGFRYPFPQYGIQQDVREGMARSYPDRAAPKAG